MESHEKKPEDISNHFEEIVENDKKAVYENSNTFVKALENANEKLEIKSTSSQQRIRQEFNLYAEDNGPRLYPVNGNIVTPPIIVQNLPEAFKFLPIFGKPTLKSKLDEFYRSKIREYIGCDLSDEDFSKLEHFCSPSHLKTGTELAMHSKFPVPGPLPDSSETSLCSNSLADNLCIVKKLKLRNEKDASNHYNRKLKYRGVRIIPNPPEDEDNFKVSLSAPLEPGKDLFFRIRLYRPFFGTKERRHNTRNSIFSNDIVLYGRQTLATLRDRIVCANDAGMRIDMSENPDDQPATTAKDLFPSGFLFINNAFYVDNRKGCHDRSEPIRQWAIKRGIGDFPRYDMDVRLESLTVKLGHPEVYVHQGCCEHLFTFSEIRLLHASDPLRHSNFPFHNFVSNNQIIYCTTCAEFGAKWIVTGCSRVPFDPAFFCDTCLKLYLYKDGKKICEFKAYSYKGNELSQLKPLG